MGPTSVPISDGDQLGVMCLDLSQTAIQASRLLAAELSTEMAKKRNDRLPAVQDCAELNHLVVEVLDSGHADDCSRPGPVQGARS